MAIGSLDTRVLCVVAAFLAASAAFLWGGGGRLALRKSATMLVVVGLTLTVATTVQLVTMPIGWLAWLSPHAAQIQAASLTALHGNVTGGSLSLDQPATKIEVLRGVVYLVALLTVLRIAHKKDGALFLERAILFAVLMVGAVAIAHQLNDAHRVFGIYQPRNSDVTIIAPLLNINQLSGYLTIGLCIAFGSMISTAPIAPRPLLGAATLALLAGIVWLASRGAVGTALGGLVLATLLTVGSRRSSTRAVTFLAPMLAGAAGVAMMAFAASPIAKQELGDTDMSKLHVQWLALRSMVQAYPWFGTGRGAFESAFPEFRTGTGFYLITHPENVVVQWVSEWGLPLSIVAAGGIAWALRPRVLLSRSVPPIGAWCALVALALHNLVDFSSEVPGIMLALVTCAGLVVAGDAGQANVSWVDRWAMHPNRVAGAIAALAIGAIALAVSARRHELFDERFSLKKMSTDASVSNDAFFNSLGAAVRAHPAEPYFPYLGAARTLLYVPNGNVVPWIDRTLERAPVYPPAHILLARWLRPRNPSQALLEYRLGAQQSGAQVGKEAESLVRSFDDALELAPAGKSGIEVLETLSAFLAPRLPATRWQIDGEILTRDPNAAAPRLRMAHDLLQDVTDEGAPWCTDNEACMTAAISAARDAEAYADVCAPYALEARALVLKGEPDSALARLEFASERVSDRASCLRELAEQAIAVKSDDRATEAIQKLADCACGNELECIQNIVAAAGLEESRGRHGRALLFYKRAADQAPERDDLMEIAAAHARGAGLHAFAADAYARLSLRHPDNEAYAKAAKDEAEAARTHR